MFSLSFAYIFCFTHSFVQNIAHRSVKQIDSEGIELHEILTEKQNVNKRKTLFY